MFEIAVTLSPRRTSAAKFSQAQVAQTDKAFPITGIFFFFCFTLAGRFQVRLTRILFFLVQTTVGDYL